jgi:hypothetical protein
MTEPMVCFLSQHKVHWPTDLLTIVPGNNRGDQMVLEQTSGRSCGLGLVRAL